MPRIQYIDKQVKKDKLATIATANTIIAEYQAQGFSLTLRQLYYQFVARALIENTMRSYKRLGDVINDGRLLGLIDWNAIVDRTRKLEKLSAWDDPADIVRGCAEQFHVDHWLPQKNYVEVWIEKDALLGVIEDVCNEFDVPYFSCRGYTSQSELWRAGMRYQRKANAGKELHILHLGDHDPSGKDMTRDVTNRIALFAGQYVNINRLALNFDQIEVFNPPPNPAKMSDSRAQGYVDEFGYDSWELDALEPSVLAGLIRDAINDLLVPGPWHESKETQKKARKELGHIATYYREAVEHIDINYVDEDDDPDGE